MVLVMKLTTFAWNVYDGRRPIDDLDKWQKTKRVVRYPTVFEFLGYAYVIGLCTRCRAAGSNLDVLSRRLYFPGILIGPYLDYASYMALIDGSLFKSVERNDKAVALRTSERTLRCAISHWLIWLV
jgi:lysophospholipid acyltransferase